MLGPGLLTVSLCGFTTKQGRGEAGRGGEVKGDGELDFFSLVEIKTYKIMAERNVATLGEGGTGKCRI